MSLVSADFVIGMFDPLAPPSHPPAPFSSLSSSRTLLVPLILSRTFLVPLILSQPSRTFVVV
ncbi:hypothetical protein F4604DRAFT_1922337 [Suillus subluteus]|nr:hypothetical protein F4604DRAFT_1922337 [Suillus subluteus]